MYISRRVWRAGLALLAMLAAGACAAPSPTPVISPTFLPTRSGALTPYLTSTPEALQTQLPSATPSLAPLPSPSPTPRTYTVKAKDDMGLIAYRFGVTVAALKAANPGVDPRAMSIGTVLIIPPSEHPTPTSAAQAAAASPTPVPVALSGPDCWPSGDGGAWCFLLARNEQSFSLENVSALVQVRWGEGQTGLLENDAYGLLDLLPPGQSLPLAVYFPGPFTPPLYPSATLGWSFALAQGDARYLEASLAGERSEIAPDGLSALVRGQVKLAEGKASLVWVAAAALDADGRVVAVRRWENASPLTAGQPQDFDLTLFSLGGKIERVTLSVEARP